MGLRDGTDTDIVSGCDATAQGYGERIGWDDCVVGLC